MPHKFYKSSPYKPEPELTRCELLAWVNGTLAAEFKSVEELRTGAAYCQFMDMMFPEAEVPMENVIFCTEWTKDFRHNFYIFNECLKKLQIQAVVPVEELIKAHYSTSLSFLKSFKQFFDANYRERSYDVFAARKGSPMGCFTLVGFAGPNDQKFIKAVQAKWDMEASVYNPSVKQLDQQLVRIEQQIKRNYKLMAEMEITRNLYIQAIVAAQQMCLECPEEMSKHLIIRLRELFAIVDLPKILPCSQLEDYQEEDSDEM